VAAIIITSAVAVKPTNSSVNVRNVRERDESSQTAADRLFWVRGPATANDLSPIEVCVRSTWRCGHAHHSISHIAVAVKLIIEENLTTVMHGTQRSPEVDCSG